MKANRALVMGMQMEKGPRLSSESGEITREWEGVLGTKTAIDGQRAANIQSKQGIMTVVGLMLENRWLCFSRRDLCDAGKNPDVCSG